MVPFTPVCQCFTDPGWLSQKCENSKYFTEGPSTVKTPILKAESMLWVHPVYGCETAGVLAWIFSQLKYLSLVAELVRLLKMKPSLLIYHL